MNSITIIRAVCCAILIALANSTDAQEKVLWNFEVEILSYPKGFEFLPQFPTKEACNPYLQKVNDDILIDSTCVIKYFINKDILPMDTDIKAHLLAIANPFQGKPHVVWKFDPNKKNLVVVKDALIVQWQKNKETLYLLDSHLRVMLCVRTEPQKIDNVKEFVLSQFQRYLSQKISSKLSKTDRVIFFDNPLKGSYAGYVQLDEDTPNGFQNFYQFFYHESGYFFVLANKFLMNQAAINVSRFHESAKFYHMNGGPERDWTEFNKEYAKEKAEMNTVRENFTKKSAEEIKNNIASEKGRVNLIELLGQKKKGKLLYAGKRLTDIFTFIEHQDMAYKALDDYYSHTWFEKIPNSAYYSDYTKNRMNIANRQEALTLLTIFQSNDAQAKQYAFMLMKEARCASIAPELLKMISVQKPTLTNAAEHAKGDFSTASNPNTIVPFLPVEPMIQAKKPEPIRRYHFLECDLLGRFGDEKTVKALKELQKKPDVAKELQEDIALMIENIEKELAEHEKWQKEVWGIRKLAREKKIAYDPSDPRFANLEKDDPEPVSPEGFRNWATTDGLFKVYAKFVSYDAKTDDVILQKPDGKTTAIERSALRQIDQEYVKQQTETATKPK